MTKESRDAKIRRFSLRRIARLCSLESRHIESIPRRKPSSRELRAKEINKLAQCPSHDDEDSPSLDMREARLSRLKKLIK